MSANPASPGQGYENLDLSPDGALITNLLGAVEGEAKSALIPLTSEFGASESHPAFLTPRMKEWYTAYIASWRIAALQPLRQRFDDIDLGKDKRGFLLEAEISKAEQKKNQSIRAEREKFYNNPKIKDVLHKIDVANKEYEAKKALNGGNAANEWSRIIYLIALSLLGMLEFFMNYSGIQKGIPSFPPAAIAAFTILIVILTAVSSDVIGKSILQWSSIFGPGVPSGEKWNHRVRLAVGFILFDLAMFPVVWARYSLLKEEIELDILGEGGVGAGLYMKIAATVGINVGIWLAGMVVAWFAHCPIPEFGKIERLLERLNRKLRKFQETGIDKGNQLHLATRDKERTNLQSRVRIELNNLPDYQTLRTEFERLRAVDGKVIAALQIYRNRLIDALKAQGGKARFEVEDLMLPVENPHRLVDAATYQRQNLELPYA
ncbi:hypothetical protein [Zavarzinia compransoris]|uniref:hypothetical protein n=1 Tax=Zavarzinia compransoris TaxID=1264899 RepID=UPI00105BE515|nr:hypothetical protein [Zavarzinia compransoris]TDP49003.1 hypothetical protein DES42_101364 [Zavarzinia compransoris]